MRALRMEVINKGTFAIKEWLCSRLTGAAAEAAAYASGWIPKLWVA